MLGRLALGKRAISLYPVTAWLTLTDPVVYAIAD